MIALIDLVQMISTYELEKFVQVYPDEDPLKKTITVVIEDEVTEGLFKADAVTKILEYLEALAEKGCTAAIDLLEMIE